MKFNDNRVVEEDQTRVLVESQHYRVLARFEALRARYWLICSVALTVVVMLWPWGTAGHTWYGWLFFLVVTALVFGFITFLVEGLAEEKLGIDARHLRHNLSRRDAGVNHYFARTDGTLTHMRKKRVADVGTFPTWDEAAAAADVKNRHLARRGTYVGPNGEAWPVDADDAHAQRR